MCSLAERSTLAAAPVQVGQMLTARRASFPELPDILSRFSIMLCRMKAICNRFKRIPG
jgi:hypothetical protein